MLRRTFLPVLGAAAPLLAGQDVAATVRPNQQAQPEPAPIRVAVNEVIVPVTVTDDEGRFVSDLDKKDFQVFDQGKEQKIGYFSRERSIPAVCQQDERIWKQHVWIERTDRRIDLL